MNKTPIRDARRTLRHHAADVAIAAGINLNHYYLIEAGKVDNPSPETLRKIERFLGMDKSQKKP